jgi:Na+/citrate or Na+/malate symporter
MTLTPNSARRWLLVTTLCFTLAVLLFFMLAPAFGYPLEFSQSLHLLEIVLPVFLGYLGYGALYVFRPRSSHSESSVEPEASDLMPIMIVGPLLVFAIAAIALIVAFGIMNSRDTGGGMSVEQLSGALSTILGLLNATTNVAVAFLFRGHHDPSTMKGSSTQ